MSTLLGNDVSVFQGDINFDVYKNNSNFLILKSTEGNGFTDPKFSRNQLEARRVSLLLGYYHFARPDLDNTPESEAQSFLNTCGELREGELLVLDYELNWVGDAVGWCKKWLDYVSSKTNCKPLIYLNQSQLKDFNWKIISNAGYGLWVAAYTYDPNNNNFVTGNWKFAAMQQWTNTQKVPGIPVDKTDGNVFFGDTDTFKKYGYHNPIDPSVDLKIVTDQRNALQSIIDKIKPLVDQIKNLL